MAKSTALIAFSVAIVLPAQIAEAGKARDYLNAPSDTWVTFYNAGYSTALTPVDGGNDAPTRFV